MANFGQKSPIYWCAGKPKDANPMALKQKAIGPSGQVVEISMATGKTIKSYIGNTYAQMKQIEKQARGWVWYEECENGCDPVAALEFRPDDTKSKLCSDCMVRETLIRTRTEAKTASGRDYASMFETRLDKLAAVLEDQMVNNQRPVISDDALLAAMDDRTKAKKASK